MDIEKIKKVRLLVSLKGTRDGKQQLWLAGTVFDRDKKPFPASITSEIMSKRIGVLEVVELYSDPLDGMEEAKETPVATSDGNKEEKAKKVSKTSIKRRKPRKPRTPKKIKK
jgi:hypothetical protein